MSIEKEGLSPTLRAESHQHLPVIHNGYRVRRLTPEECGRLQGFPDGWAVEGSDTAKYKMWGNGMCLVNILYIMQGLIEFDEEIL